MRTKQNKKPSEAMKKIKPKKNKPTTAMENLTPPPTPRYDYIEEEEENNFSPPRTPKTPEPEKEKETTPPPTWKIQMENGKIKLTRKKKDQKENEIQPIEITNNLRRRNKDIFQLLWPSGHKSWKEFHQTADEHPKAIREYLEKMRKKIPRRYNDLTRKHPYLMKC